MTYGVVKVEHYNGKPIAEIISKQGIPATDVIEVQITYGSSGNKDIYKKSTKLKNWLNCNLDANFIAAFAVKNAELPTNNSHSLSLDDDVIICTSSGKWISIGTSEWGSMIQI
ncbi:hypothetical protein VCHA53O466_50283 [Vibrio chagasii]|nr:hypothetical protein VCHA53O466_50283 [Vibrio chagasii]